MRQRIDQRALTLRDRQACRIHKACYIVLVSCRGQVPDQ
jgi:hypothetical protein